ncbi:hypothetical protein KFK09_027724 [Dendrobium nobile]|uniref:Oxidative stress 3 n=1 Tax=Dendrobium nobile TaxID=94219 RepID=A0A8T3A1B9_DENNO|nr:hypothetical protein KFK09_027724 [Dendrobium nobile]
MAEGLKQKPCEILLPSGEDDYDDCDGSMFNEEDDEVSFSSFSSNSLAGPLYELSSLMADLPIKRGLSNFFQGKSQSFSSLTEVKCIEDLAKKECPYNKRMKSYRRNEKSKSYMNQKLYYAPNHSSRIISKSASRSSCGSMLGRSRSNKASSISIQKNYLYVLIKEKEED